MGRRKDGGWKMILQPRWCEVVLLTGELEAITSTCVVVPNMVTVPRNVVQRVWQNIPIHGAFKICVCSVSCRKELWS